MATGFPLCPQRPALLIRLAIRTDRGGAWTTTGPTATRPTRRVAADPREAPRRSPRAAGPISMTSPRGREGHPHRGGQRRRPRRPRRLLLGRRGGHPRPGLPHRRGGRRQRQVVRDPEERLAEIEQRRAAGDPHAEAAVAEVGRRLGIGVAGVVERALSDPTSISIRTSPAVGVIEETPAVCSPRSSRPAPVLRTFRPPDRCSAPPLHLPGAGATAFAVRRTDAAVSLTYRAFLVPFSPRTSRPPARPSEPQRHR